MTSQGIAVTWLRSTLVGDSIVAKHIMYLERGMDRVWSEQQEVTQVSTVIDSVAEAFRDAAIAVDGSTVHLAYQDLNEGPPLEQEVLHTSKAVGGSWPGTPFALSNLGDGIGGNDPAIVVDTGGNVIVTYQEGTNLHRVLPEGQSTWTPARKSGTSLYDQFTFDSLGCAVDTCLYADAVGGPILTVVPFYDGAHKAMFLGGADFLLNRVYRDFICSTWVATDSIVVEPCPTGGTRCRHCLDDADMPVVLSGTWNSDTKVYDWWGHPGFEQGNIVRNGPRKFETFAAPGDLCEAPCFSVPSSITPLSTPHKFPYRRSPSAGAAVTSGSSVTVYTLWAEIGGTSYLWDGSAPDPVATGGDIWCRVWELDPTGWTKSSDIQVVSRTPWYSLQPDSMLPPPPSPYDDLHDHPKATSDDDNWIHLVSTRDDRTDGFLGFEGMAGEDFWPDSTRQVYYVTHEHGADADDWGWEFPLSVRDGEEAAAAFPSIAAGDGALHVVWTQYNKDNDALDVVYREGIVLPQSTAGNGAHEEWNGLVFLDSDFTVLAGDTLTIDAGTIVYAQTPPATTQDDPPTGDLPELIVQGTLLVSGEADNLVLLTSTRGSTTGEWGGIRFEESSDDHVSRVEHAIFRNAAQGLTVRGRDIAFHDCTFENNSVADIVVQGDTRIRSGEAWNVVGPVDIGIADSDPFAELLSRGV